MTLAASIYTDFRPGPGRPFADHYAEAIEDVRLSERLGFHCVWTTEQHGVDDGYLPAQLPMLAALARETSTIRLGAGVILLPLAQPRRVVEEACVVDVLSGGRLTLGVGAGAYPHEFRAFGVPRERRGRLLEEAIAFIKQGLAGDDLPDGLPVNVPPIQRPIPLVVGGLAERAIDRAVRLADGHFSYEFSAPERVLPRLWEERLGPALKRHGRTPGSFRLIAATIVWASDAFEREWLDVVGPAFQYQQRRYAEWDAGRTRAEGYSQGSVDLRKPMRDLLVGRPDEVAGRLAELARRFPLDELVFWYRLPGVPASLAREHLERFAGEVLPAVNRALAG